MTANNHYFRDFHNCDATLRSKARVRLWRLFAIWLLLSYAAVLSCAGQAVLILRPGDAISTLAGTGRDGRTSAGDATAAALGSPRGLVYDSSGNLYVADARNHVVDRISLSGTLNVFAGNGTQGFSGDGGPAARAQLNSPTALVLGSDGSLYIADTANHRVRRIDSNGIMQTIAGIGSPGATGDGGLATAAALRSPSGLAFGSDGSLYIADTGNHRVRRIDPSGVMRTVAGTGHEDYNGDGGPALAASFRSPGALQMLPDGRLLIADRAARRIRALMPDGTVTAYVTGKPLRQPQGLALDTAGSLLIADAGNQQVVRTGPDASAAVAASVLAGSGTQGVATSSLPGSAALDSPSGVAAGTSGIAISDSRNHQVQRVSLASLVFGDVPAGQASAPQTLTLQNGGSALLAVAAVQLPSGFSRSDAVSSCPSSAFTLSPGESCAVAVIFAPTAQGLQSGVIQVGMTGAPAAVVKVNGNGIATGVLANSVTALHSNGSISYAGSPVLLSAVVNGALAAQPGGNITFYDGSSPMATVALNAGSATFSTASLQAGSHTLRASYSGDGVYRASTSTDITQTVVAPPDFAVTPGAVNYSGKAGGTISIPFVILPVNGTLNHTVQLGISGLPAGSSAVFTPGIFTLAGDPVNVNVTIGLPTTLASHAFPAWEVAAAAGLIFLLPRRRFPGLSPLLLLLAAIILGFGGCGGGFRTSATGTDGTTPKTFTYTAVVTATTTGVLGDTLTHSTTIGLVVTP